MRKKILFVMESLGIGGAEKSLITILSLIDKRKYDISLYLFNQTGDFISQIPNKINILDISKIDRLQRDFKTDWITYLFNGNFKRSFYSFMWLIGCFYNKYIKKEKEYIGWNYKKHLFSDIPGEYDVAIGFLEKKTTYFIIDHVKSNKKIAFMHTDYESIPHDEQLDFEYYKHIDYLVAVSEHTGDTMLKYFPFLAGKIKVIKNMVAPDLIKKLAEKRAPEMECYNDTIKITTVARLTSPKGIDIAVRVLNSLINQSINVEWFIVGEGYERQYLEKMINGLKINKKFHLIGAKVNPYPYIKQCDIYVQPSRWEGYGITVAEAKVLCKPIITSNIPEFREQIENNITGIICDNEEAIITAIKKIIKNKKIRDNLINNLKKEKYDCTELKKIEEIL